MVCNLLVVPWDPKFPKKFWYFLIHLKKKKKFHKSGKFLIIHLNRFVEHFQPDALLRSNRCNGYELSSSIMHGSPKKRENIHLTLRSPSSDDTLNSYLCALYSLFLFLVFQRGKNKPYFISIPQPQEQSLACSMSIILHDMITYTFRKFLKY